MLRKHFRGILQEATVIFVVLGVRRTSCQSIEDAKDPDLDYETTTDSTVRPSEWRNVLTTATTRTVPRTPIRDPFTKRPQVTPLRTTTRENKRDEDKPLKPAPLPRSKQHSFSVPQPTAFYTVKAGDTAYVIAGWYAMTLHDLMKLNPAKGDMTRIYPGDRLVVYNGPSSRRDNSQNDAQSNILEPRDYEPVAVLQLHTVMSGETWWDIAQRYNVLLVDLQNINPRELGSGLRAGARIKIPLLRQ